MFIIKNAQSITYRDKNIAFVLMLKIILSIFYYSCEKNRHIYKVVGEEHSPLV
jgi:hypothetical protein